MGFFPLSINSINSAVFNNDAELQLAVDGAFDYANQYDPLHTSADYDCVIIQPGAESIPFTRQDRIPHPPVQAKELYSEDVVAEVGTEAISPVEATPEVEQDIGQEEVEVGEVVFVVLAGLLTIEGSIAVGAALLVLC